MARVQSGPFTSALVVESPHPSLDEALARAGLSAKRRPKVGDEGALVDALNETGAEILFKRSRLPVSRAVLEACPKLMAVQLCCIGDDSVDKVACADHGVLVFNDPVSNGRSVVELATAHLIALSRRLYETDAALRQHQWDKSHDGRFEVLGKTLGIVGLGNIGRQVARVAEALGMEVHFFDNRPVAQEVGIEMGYKQADTLVGLFRGSDLVTVHASARDTWGQDNEGVLNSVLAQLGADRGGESPRVFLNLARGNLHSSEALLDAVRSGAVRRAAVDVYPEEPGPAASSWRNPYAEEPRIACTPHIGAATQEAQPRIAKRVAGTAEGFSRYGSLRDCVFAPRAILSLREVARGKTILAVVHSTTRGTKRAVDDAIFDAEASNLGSQHRDFPNGIAYDLSVIDRPLSDSALAGLVEHAAESTRDASAIRSVRQIAVPAGGF